MDSETVAVYESSAREYRTQRRPYQSARAEAFDGFLSRGALRLDLGCGPGLYVPLLGEPLVAADAARSMLRETRDHSAETPVVQCDLTALPFNAGAFGGVWASKAHQHLDAGELPGALAEIHRVMPVGGRVELTIFAGSRADDTTSAITGDGDSFPGRLFTFWKPEALSHLLRGAGFTVDHLAVSNDEPRRIDVTALRARTLADTVGPGMRVLLCGLNPSLFAADAGVGFARPGNRLWPALRMAALTRRDRDPIGLLRQDHIGMTDLVKRATVAASELKAEEYRSGLVRVSRLCRILEPDAVCFVGLAGWRASVDRQAIAGWQTERVGPTPVYVMPSTSGLNARTSLATLADHLRAAARPPTPTI